MAKRSDFAQKLLDDLRLRKEKLGYITSSGQQSAQPPYPDYHRNSLMSTRGTGEARNMNYQNRKKQVSLEATEVWFSTKQNKAAAAKIAAKDIVPVGTVANIHKSVDVSMALALALSKSGKLHYVAKFGNELIPHSEAIYYGETNNQQFLHSMKHHAKHYPFLSNLQIGEISKGVQNLNKILETYSNKSNIGKDSTQIGRALLKGTMDLEESLKMLVTLQEASDYMVGTQGRQVKLLKGKEEDESSNRKVDQKSLYSKTNISFDGFTDHLYELGKAKDDTISQRQRNMSSSCIRKGTRTTKTNYADSSSHATMQTTGHRRTLSYGSDSISNSLYTGIQAKHGHGDEIRNSASKGKFSTSTNIKPSDPESKTNGSVKMPSIVAKLMGLEEFPTSKIEVKKAGQKDPNSKTESVNGQSLKADAIVKKEVISSKKHLVQIYDEHRIQNEKLVEETKAISKDKMLHVEKLTVSPKYASNWPSNMKIENTNMNHNLKEGTARSHLDQSGKKAGKGEQKIKRSQLVPQEKKPNLEIEQQRTKKQPFWSQDEMAEKSAFLKPNSGQEQLAVTSNQSNTRILQKKSTGPMTKTRYALPTITKEKDHEKPKVRKEMKADQKSRKSIEETSTNQVLSNVMVFARNGSSGKDGDIQISKEHSNSSHQEIPIEMNGSLGYTESSRISEKIEDIKPLRTNPTTEKEKPQPQTVITVFMKPLHIPNAKKVDTENMKVHKGENHKVLGDSPGYIKTPNKKIQSSFLNDLEKRWKERTSKDKGAKVNFCDANSEQHIENATKSTLLLDDSSLYSDGDGVLKEMLIEEPKGKNMKNEASQQQEAYVNVNSEPRPSNLKEKRKEGVRDARNIDNCNLLKWQNEATSEGNEQGSLTQDEYLLKQLLINNQHFLNTVQAFFKVKIPICVLQDDKRDYPKEERKLLLDCGCELVRRKGKREVIHAMERPYALGKVRHLNALVKELNNDIESLKFPNIRVLTDDTAEFLHMMLERDIQNTKPDVNCMWDIGWSNSIFASLEKNEVTRDLEIQVLGGLISELARELVDET